MNDEQAKLVVATKEPNVKELIAAYKRCDPTSDGWNRLRDNDVIRYNVWDNKCADGKKHDRPTEPAFPFDGASDCEIFLADSVIMEHVAVCVVAFWRAVVRALSPQGQSDNVAQAAYATALLDWLVHTKLFKELIREVELSAQYIQHYGWCALHITWERDIAMQMHEVSFQRIAEIASLAPPGSPARAFPELILDPAQEDVAVQIAREHLTMLVQIGFDSVLGNEKDRHELLKNYTVSEKRVRQLIRDLREKQVAQIPLPYFCKNQPSIVALKPWEDVFVPSYMTDVQLTPYIFVRDRIPPYELRKNQTVDGWDKDWCDEAMKKAGTQSSWTWNTWQTSSGDTQFQWLAPDATQHDLIEIIYGYNRQIDDDGIPLINHTVMHAALDTHPKDTEKPFYAKNESLNYAHKQMPFVIGTRERPARNVTSSRGIPQLLRTRQQEIKVHRDALRDLTSIAVLPPVNVYDNGLGVQYRFGPAIQNTVTMGREPKFMEVPDRGAVVAFDLIKVIRQEVAEEQGLLRPDVEPVAAQLLQQTMVTSFLTMWAEAFQQMFQLAEQFMSPDEYMEITGAEQPLPKDAMQISRQRDFVLSFDVREADMEHVMKQFEAITQGVLPLDTEGTIDRAKLVENMVRAINPSLAKDVVIGREGASKKMFKAVQNDILLMFAGNEPDYLMDGDPTAQSRLQFLDQIVQGNTKYIQALGSPQLGLPTKDPDFAQKMEKYRQSLQFNIQQQQNKTVGRIGVNPGEQQQPQQPQLN